MGGSRGMGGLGGGMLHGAHPFSVAAWLVRRRRRRWRQGRRGRRGRQGVGRAKNACDRQPVPPVYSDSMDDDDGNMLHGAWWTVMRGTAARKSYAARLCWGGELTPGRVRRRQESRETGARAVAGVRSGVGVLGWGGQNHRTMTIWGTGSGLPSNACQRTRDSAVTRFLRL